MQVGTYVFLDGNYADAVLRRDEPHPFTPSLTVRDDRRLERPARLRHHGRGGQGAGRHGRRPRARVLTGAPAGSGYRIVGDDMGRIDLRPGAPAPAVGDAVEVLPPYCYLTVVLHPWFHCVRGDVLVDIWPVDARVSA